MTSNSSWVPDESPKSLFSERCWFQSMVITAIAYGAAITLYFLSFYRLVHEQNRLEFRKRLLFLVFITIAFLLGTLFMIGLVGFTQMAFIDNRNYPGGPNSFETDMFSAPTSMLANVALILSNWLSDALVVWRFKVIYQNPSCRVPLWIIMLFPCLLFAGSVAMGIMYLSTNPYMTNDINFAPYSVALSLGLNIVLTIAIVLRLLIFRYRIVSLMGQRYGTQYISAAVILIESAALYSTVSVTFLILFWTGNVVSRVFGQSLVHFQTIATLLIVFRVAQGKVWTQDTAVFVTSGSDPSQLGNMQLASPRVPVTLEISA